MLPRIQKYLDDQSTGCLEGTDALGIPLQVYFMDGNLVAAHAGDDAHFLLRTLLQRTWLRVEEAQKIREEISDSDSIYSAIMEVNNEPQVREVFYERFRENLCRLLDSKSALSFSLTDTFLIPNVQLSHDSRALLEACYATVERTEDLRSSRTSEVYQKGSRPALSGAERRLLHLFDESLPLLEAVRRSPYESFQTWDLLVDLVDRGALVSLQAPPPQSPSPRETTPPLSQNSAPRLSRVDAEQKIRAASRVTQAFFKASDALSGPGAGRAQLRLLLDGGPSQFRSLFTGLPIEQDGALHSEELVLRLRTRVGPERRGLLNNGLRDLIQRTLSLADEGLDENSMNHLLEEISGHDAEMGW